MTPRSPAPQEVEVRRAVDVGHSAAAVVIGAGIVGAACAYALAIRGLSVVLVERDAPARGTSGACEGNLVLWDRPTVPDLELTRWSHRRWEELSGELFDATGLDIEFDRKGSLMLAQDEATLAAAQARCAWLAEQGVPHEWLDGAALHEVEPDLAPSIEHGALFPMDSQIEPRIATAALVAGARARGTAVLLHEPVTSIELRDDGRRAVVTTAEHVVETPHLVVAAGVWTPRLLAGIVDLPVSARKGQIAVVTAPIHVRHKVMEAGYAGTVASSAGGLQIAAVVESTRSGSILLGSSRLLTDPDDRTVDVDVLGRIVARALEFFPGLASGRLFRSYAGLRPMSPDHAPLVGPLPGRPAVLLATGHEGGGVMMAAATGELIARRVTGEPIPVPDAALLPDRLVAA